jgi:hypothetical protein
MFGAYPMSTRNEVKTKSQICHQIAKFTKENSPEGQSK